MFLMAADEGGEHELLYFKKLDEEFNKVVGFYKVKVEEVMEEAGLLNKQMEALIAFRVKVEHPNGWIQCLEESNKLASDAAASRAALASTTPLAAARSIRRIRMDVIDEESSMRQGRLPTDESGDGSSNEEGREMKQVNLKNNNKENKQITERIRPAPLEILERVRFNTTQETPRSTIKGFLNLPNQTDLKFSKDNLRKAEEQLKKAFVGFYHKLRLLKSYSFLNIMVASRSASKPYMKMVDNSYLGSSEEHFSNANRSKGMNILRPKKRKERHRVTFSMGFLVGCTISLIMALILIARARNLLNNSGRVLYMETMFPLYSVSLPDFLLADQFTSQVQALRSLEFYICYYGWGDYKLRQNNCRENDVFKTFSYIIAAIPYWWRFLQRKMGYNGLKYLSTIVAVSATNKGLAWKITALITSIIATVVSTYWDIVIDWGLFQRNSKNRWLRDKLLVPHKSVYYAAIVLNVLLRLAWMQTVLSITVFSLHRQTIDIIKDMYEGASTSVRTNVGRTEEFPITIGVHQGSALSPFLFAIVMDELTRGIQNDVPWCMMFADDIVLIDETKVGVQQKLELWRDTLEARGFRLSRSKTEYMECRFSDNSDREAERITFDGKVVHGSTFFRYLGSIIQKDGELDGDVAHRIKAGWLKWKSATGVLCDPDMPHRLKGKFYRTAIRPALLYGTECWAVKQCHVQKMNVAEMRMLRWMCGHTKKDRLRNEVIREKVRVASIEDKMMENRLRWFGHVRRRPVDAPVRRLESWGTSNIVKGRGRPKKTWIKLIENDMRFLGIRESMAMERQIWRERIRVTMTTLVASLEIIRRGVWNFFRLENEHLNNVGKYRAFKTVPLPFNYDEDEDKDD
ncbi:hypothetical protein OROMI_022806 [Orobanche minor]